MKNFLIVISCFLLNCYSAYAQRVIPKFGVAQSTIRLSQSLRGTDKIGDKRGVVVGVAVELPLSKKLAFQPEIVFHQKGWTRTIEKNQRSESYTLNYFELPLLLKLNLSVFHVNAGPFVSYGYDGSYKYQETVLGRLNNGDGGIRFGKTPETITSGSVYLDNNIDYGIQMGLGFTVIKRLTFDLRYSLSYADIYKNHPGDNLSRNEGFQLTLGFPSLGRE